MRSTRTRLTRQAERMFGMQVRIYGDARTKAQERAMAGEPALWLSNHRTRIDWMLLWSLALRTKTLAALRIVLKAELRKLPIFGWAMQHFVFIFLVRLRCALASSPPPAHSRCVPTTQQRRAADDQSYVAQILPFLRRTEPEATYLLFPEGTDMSDANVLKSAKYAEKIGVPVRKYSLYPRTTGWTFMFPLFKHSVNAVYDITMFYVDHMPNERPSELSLLSGRMPRTIHIYLERIDIKELSDLDEQALVKWMEQRFERRERLLKDFYENGQLPDGAQRMFEDDQTSTVALIAAFWVALILVACKFALTVGLLWSVVLGGIVCIGYAAFTAFGPGIDGFLMSTL